MNTPVAPLSGLEISGIGIVVPDAVVAAKQYVRLGGVQPWCLHDMTVHVTGQPEEHVRVARGHIGRLEIDLIHPLAGVGTHGECLTEHGGGVHHLSFGARDDYEQKLELLSALGCRVQTEGTVDGGSRFAYLDTLADLGARLEMVKAGASTPPYWGQYQSDAPQATGFTNREIKQVGIVVGDVKRAAARWTELLGISDWNFVEFEAPEAWRGVLHDVPATNAQFHIKAALAYHGAMQIELLQPVSGTSTHMDFLRRHGVGVHHLSFDAIDDHDAVLDGMQQNGISVEMGGELGREAWFTYLETQSMLGTIYEIVRLSG